MKIICPHCGKSADKATGEVTRARDAGLRLFCGRRCSGLGRRKPKKPKAQRLAEKRAYDIAYRAKNWASRKLQKAEYHRRTYDRHDCNGTGRVWLSPKGEISKYLGEKLVGREKSS